MYRWFALVLMMAVPTACAGQVVRPNAVATLEVDSARVVDDLRFLSSPDLAGRGAGTPGNRVAREYIQRELADAGVRPFDRGWSQSFSSGMPGVTNVTGTNIVGWVEGTEVPGRFIVVTAHYDHLGERNGTVYPGADDNASGSAALLEIARQVVANPLGHSVIFAAFDAEESGLRGARAFVADPPVALDAIVLNVNMDMVSRNTAGEIYVAGPFHYPFLAEHVRTVAERSELEVLIGHDQPIPTPSDDWTGQSDHAAFHAARIPFAYFGVEDHPDYHRPTDTFENTDPAFFVRAVDTVLDFIREVDRSPAFR